MALGAKPFSSTASLTNTFTTNVLAAAGTNTTRFIKHIRVTNSGAATTYSLSLKASGVAPLAADPGLIALLATVPANSSVDHYFSGDGLAQTAAGALTITGGATVTGTVSVAIMGAEVVS